jgi:hypothetical protein
VVSVSATIAVVSGTRAWLRVEVAGIAANVVAEVTPINNRCGTGNEY